MTALDAGARRLRVLQIIPNLGVGGAQRMLAHLATHLDRTACEVSVLSLYDPSGTAIARELTARGIAVEHLGKRPGLDPRVWPRLSRALRRIQPDVLHTHLPVLHYTLPWGLGPFRGRFVHTVHTVAEQDAAWMPGRAAHALAFRAGVAPVAICEFVASTIARVYGVRPRAVIPNGIPVRTFATPTVSRERWRAANRVPADAIAFACVARLAPPKNTEGLLEAFAALDARDAVLLLAGDGPLEAELRARARRSGVEDRVHFLGARADVPDLLAASDVFVLPSSWEGHPLSVMEAMAAGAAVVATAVGGVPELVRHGETGLLVPPADGPALASALRQLYADSAQRARLGRAARQVAAERFDASLMAARYADLYRELMTARAAWPSIAR
ncbi:glycosyltransferase [Anaeromyxobacter oryzae]|uniref:Glycosyl transferase family 1 n=1 Tax=Anaeromyxobacter oryzae TaxID=2918170 RepID=A0ABN6MZN5_9BACT|nr:glycosyltransferase [Anaeromyxobacter oryzae]BDG06321.1 glycosyl transferase family 1 [Anaeromyxobacter oryzae]